VPKRYTPSSSVSTSYVTTMRFGLSSRSVTGTGSMNRIEPSYGFIV
jgi:hypothetical protein